MESKLYYYAVFLNLYLQEKEKKVVVKPLTIVSSKAYNIAYVKSKVMAYHKNKKFNSKLTHPKKYHSKQKPLKNY